MAGPTAAPAMPLMAWAVDIAGNAGTPRITIEAAMMAKAEAIISPRLARVASTSAPSGVVAIMPA